VSESEARVLKNSAQKMAEQADGHRESAFAFMDEARSPDTAAITNAILALDSRIALLCEVLAGPIDVRVR